MTSRKDERYFSAPTCNDTSAFRLVVLHADPLETLVKDVMSTTLYPGRPMSRDEAAEILQKRKIHHAAAERVREIRRDLLVAGHREERADAKVINVRDVQWVTHKGLSRVVTKRFDPRLTRSSRSGALV